MNTQKKIDLAGDTTRLCLHKEGIFCKLYNQHAMLFIQNIKGLKVKAKFIKTADQYVYSCGFPASIIGEIKKQLTANGGLLEESEKLLTVADITWKKQGDYAAWSSSQREEISGAIEKNSTTYFILGSLSWFILGSNLYS